MYSEVMNEQLGEWLPPFWLFLQGNSLQDRECISACMKLLTKLCSYCSKFCELLSVLFYFTACLSNTTMQALAESISAFIVD